MNSKYTIDRVANKVGEISSELNGKIDLVRADMKTEISVISRQFRITFGGLITTIVSVFMVIWYFHTLAL